MSKRWTHKVVEVPMKMFGNGVKHVQAELDKAGVQGWELVAVDKNHYSVGILLYFKKEA